MFEVGGKRAAAFTEYGEPRGGRKEEERIRN